MPLNLEGLTKGERFIVEWQFNRLGSFYAGLAELIFRADPDNFEKLGQGFPEEALGMFLFKNNRDWWAKTCVKAGVDNEAL